MEILGDEFRQKVRPPNIFLYLCWKFLKKMPQQWQISYENQGLKLKIKLALTSFGHIGVFPEQAHNWDFIFSEISKINGKNPRVLNLFAYTGVASLAAAATNDSAVAANEPS